MTKPADAEVRITQPANDVDRFRLKLGEYIPSLIALMAAIMGAFWLGVAAIAGAPWFGVVGWLAMVVVATGGLHLTITAVARWAFIAGQSSEQRWWLAHPGMVAWRALQSEEEE